MKNTVFEIKKNSSVFPFLWHLSIKIRFYYFESQSALKVQCYIISYLMILDNTVSQTDLLRLSFLYFCLHFSNLTDERASLIREIALSNLFRMHPSGIIGKQTNKSPTSRSTRNYFFQSEITIFSFQFTLFHKISMPYFHDQMLFGAKVYRLTLSVKIAFLTFITFRFYWLEIVFLIVQILLCPIGTYSKYL